MIPGAISEMVLVLQVWETHVQALPPGGGGCDDALQALLVRPDGHILRRWAQDSTQ